MSARARARIVELARSSNVNTKFVIEMLDLFLEAVKEEIKPENGLFATWINVAPPPQLIQGYTAEQWQEIIAGGYLCEFANRPELPWWLGRLKETPKEKGSICMASCDEKIQHYGHCRPAQIKGVMRPIFVEPVDKEAWCVFFSSTGSPFSFRAKYSYLDKIPTAGHARGGDSFPTQYIEV